MEKTKRLQSLDLFKGIAMLLIILVHLNQSFTSYIEPLEFFQMGCQLFFVASGFGACLSLYKNQAYKSFWKSTGSFYLSRIKAIIIPVYLIILIFYILTSLSTHFWQPVVSISSSQKFVDILLSMLFLNGLFPDSCNAVYPGAWFIGTAMFLYILAPFLFASLVKKKRNFKLLLSLLFTVISYGIIYYHVISIPGGEDGWLASNSFGYFSFLNQLPCFLLGMILCFDYKNGINTKNWLFTLLGLISSLYLTLYFFYESSLDFDNVLCTLCMGFFGFFFLRLLLQIESLHKYHRLFQLPEAFGKNSLYIFLTHTIIVWYLIDFLSNVFGLYGIDFGKRRFLYLMIPICIVLSYLLGLAYKFLCESIKKGIHSLLVRK